MRFYFLILLLPVCLGYPTLQDAIPNGKNVQHPCIPNTAWPGVGHENKNGGGPRNPFGLAFAAAGYKWTTALCSADTDGDGKTNGYELGDPKCVWAPGKVPTRTTDITHPGVCDPMNSTQCKGRNSFVSCQADDFESTFYDY